MFNTASPYDGPLSATARPIAGQPPPYTLPYMYPARSAVKPGDIVVLPSGEVAAVKDLSGVQACTITYLTGLQAAGTEQYALTDLEHAIECGRGDIIAAGCHDREQRWWVTGDTPLQPPIDTGDLTFAQSRSQRRVNEFLSHPLVDHGLGAVATHKALFTATAGQTDSTAAVTVLDIPARSVHDYQRVTISRYASHPVAPDNTASWMLARVCEWAKLHGYRSIRTNAGVTNDNIGTIYRAAGFTFDGKTTTDGDGFTSRPGRDSYGEFTRRRFYRQLDSQNIRVPPPAAHESLPVTVPDAHANLSINQPDSLPADTLSAYLTTPPTRQSTTLQALSDGQQPPHTSTPPTDQSQPLSPSNLSLVDFERNLGLFAATRASLDRTECAEWALIQRSTSSTVPTDETPAPAVAIGAHRAGTLTTAVTAHYARDCSDVSQDIDPSAYIVTSFATALDKGWKNVATWVLSAIRARAQLDDSRLYVHGTLSDITPAKKQANIDTAVFSGVSTSLRPRTISQND